MELKEITFQHRGKTISGTVAIPVNLSQAFQALGEEEVFQCFVLGYLERQKRLLRLKRVKKHVKLNLESLTLDQKEALKKAGIKL